MNKGAMWLLTASLLGACTHRHLASSEVFLSMDSGEGEKMMILSILPETASDSFVSAIITNQQNNGTSSSSLHLFVATSGEQSATIHYNDSVIRYQEPSMPMYISPVEADSTKQWFDFQLSREQLQISTNPALSPTNIQLRFEEQRPFKGTYVGSPFEINALHPLASQLIEPQHTISDSNKFLLQIHTLEKPSPLFQNTNNFRWLAFSCMDGTNGVLFVEHQDDGALKIILQRNLICSPEELQWQDEPDALFRMGDFTVVPHPEYPLLTTPVYRKGFRVQIVSIRKGSDDMGIGILYSL